MNRPLQAALALACLSLATSAQQSPERAPNIVIVLADDLGWGDVGAFNSDSQIPTPHIDGLAAEGMHFTDAHSPGAWCTPSRYGLMTGRAAWRRGAFQPGVGPVLDPDEPTLPGLLRAQGYTTAMVGKWHLGFEGGPGTAGEDKGGGPLDRGFDRFFGIHASLDIPPYYYLDGRTPLSPPTETVEGKNTKGWTNIQGEFWRGGACAPGFVHAEVLPRFTERAVEWIQELAADEAPFFLYVALASPHTPWFSSGRFETGAGLYGDFVADTDSAVGDLLAALDRAGARENTLVLFTSDNGPVWYPDDVRRFGHSATGPFRGMKSDAWEGGHRMPLVVRWPSRIPAGARCAETVCFTDFMPTFAELVGAPPTDGDGASLLPLFSNPAGSLAPRTLVLKSDASVVREGDWKLITHLGSGGFSRPRRENPLEGGPAAQLYDLAADPGETMNLWRERPDVALRLEARRRAITGLVTYGSLEAAFRRGAAALHANTELTGAELPAAVASLAVTTFGSHPEVVSAEAERRYAALPMTTLVPGSWIERARWELPGEIPAHDAWQLFAWDPERLGAWGKSALLARQLGAEAFGRRGLVGSRVPDAVYRTGEGPLPDLVVASLGERFVVEVQPSEVGGCRPTRVRWLVRR